MLPKSLIEDLEAHRDDHLEQLFQLLRFPSVSSQPAREGDCRACAEWIAEHLGKLGFSCELRPWRKHPILLARRNCKSPEARTVLIYGHYDVQPPDPLEQWQTPPFEPTIRDGCIYARGASDDKGQFFAHVKAVEAYLRTQGDVPANVVFFLDGEEEIGSPELEQFIASAADALRADFAVISDSEFFAAGLPTITYGLRGLAYVELTLSGPREDLHSGIHGGAVVNPLNALCRMIAAMHDDRGRVALPGFYDDVLELSEPERESWEKLPFNPDRYAADLGTQPAGGEQGLGLLERRWARPTLDCNGIVGGYQHAGSKTVIPAAATAKISMRLVPNQRPRKIVEALRQFIGDNTPPGVRASLKVSAEARPVLICPDGPAIGCAKEALKEAFGAETAMVRNGASVPITELIQRLLKIDPILMGLGLPDDNLHAPNERFRLDQFHHGIVAAASLLGRLARL